MADALGIETRSRSRSKTPGILFGENGDSEKRNARKVPTISLIEEEDDVIEVVPSSQGSRPKRQRRSAKAVTSDTSTDVSTDSLKTTAVSKTSVTTTTVTEVKKTTNGKEESSEATSKTTVTKSVIDGPDAPESQSIFNNIYHAIKTSTPILSNKRSQRITQDVMSPAVNIAEHPAYKEYMEAGEYWNKYPKTDYTYSELSPHRRELKNGIVAMPNMSRRSLEKYQNRVENMIQNNPTEESFLRRKFLSNTSSTSFQKRSADLQYDSTDEVDVSELRRQLYNRRKPADNIVNRFFLTIVSFFYSSYYSVTQRFRRIFYRTNDRYSYTPIRRQQGFFRRASESIKKYVLLAFSKVYLFVSTVLCLDTWILYTRSDNVDKNARRKRFLLLLLILLPLLLLGGTYTYLDPPKNLSFPKISLPELRFPKLTMPKFSFPSISLPSLPTLAWPAFLTFTLPRFNFNFSWPEISFEWLSFSRPEWLKFPEFSFSWPEISFEWLSFSRPEWLKLPDLSFSRPEWLKFPDLSFSLPAISLPTINWPTISLPSLPKFSLPSMPTFDFSLFFAYIGDKFSAFKVSSVEVFDQIRDATFGLLNEAQIVWSENFNAVSNAK